MRTINGKNWLSTHDTAKMFDVSPMTVLRWCTEDTAAATVGLQIVQDPMNQRWYIEEESARQLLKKFDIGVPIKKKVAPKTDRRR